jgi:hypothetical protein
MTGTAREFVLGIFARFCSFFGSNDAQKGGTEASLKNAARRVNHTNTL